IRGGYDLQWNPSRHRPLLACAEPGEFCPGSVAPQQVIRALTSRRLPPRQKSLVAIGRYGPTQQVTALGEGRSTYDEDGLRRRLVPAKLRSERGRGPQT